MPNTKAIQRFGTQRPTLCCVCRRTAWNLMYRPNDRAKGIWICDNHECIKASKAVYNMPQQRLDEFEKKAAREASEQCGQFLDQIGETDVAKLNEGQWVELWQRFVRGYENSMRTSLVSDVAPF